MKCNIGGDARFFNSSEMFYFLGTFIKKKNRKQIVNLYILQTHLHEIVILYYKVDYCYTYEQIIIPINGL